MACLAICSLSCKEIPPEIPPISPPEGDRKVLIEEFSGVQCPNCPVGAAQIENLRAIYGERVIAITHHAYLTGVLSAPLQDSKFDFRTVVSDEILNFLGLPQGIPAATIDRRQFEGENELMLSPNQWAAKVESELSVDAPLGLVLNSTYDSLSRSFQIEVRVFAQEDIEGDIRFHLGLIESGMIDRQIDGNIIVEEYEHNHILRSYLTNAVGDIISGDLQQGEEWTKIYSGTLPEEQGWWIAENIHAIGFVSNITSGSKNVLQAEEIPLIIK